MRIYAKIQLSTIINLFLFRVMCHTKKKMKLNEF